MGKNASKIQKCPTIPLSGLKMGTRMVGEFQTCDCARCTMNPTRKSGKFFQEASFPIKGWSSGLAYETARKARRMLD